MGHYPIMVSLADMLGLTRQTAVLAFQFGDGLSNMLVATSGVLMGILPLFLQLIALAATFLIVAVLIAY
ncbi:hypothetical protein JYU09_01430 [bacterium AH-315-O15]|nr:hypothetical protein [bacterium AH-315-O15]